MNPWWITGLVDGEGHFGMIMYGYGGKPETPRFNFKISLRRDDTDVLYKVQTYFNCGNIIIENKRRYHKGSNPCSHFIVTNTPDLYMAVLHHFDQFPLQSKKINDYAIWRRGIELKFELHYRKRGRRKNKYRDEERDVFRSISRQLKQVRVFNNSYHKPA